MPLLQGHACWGGSSSFYLLGRGGFMVNFPSFVRWLHIYKCGAITVGVKGCCYGA